MSPIVQAVFAIIAAIITAVVIPLIKSKTNALQQEEIKRWVKIAVAAAEQIFTGSGRGQEKKRWVLDFLAKYNLKVDTDAIDAMVEAAVWELKNM